MEKPVRDYHPGFRGDVTFTEIRALPLTSTSLCVIQGTMWCFNSDVFPRAKEDIFLPVFEIPVVAETCVFLVPPFEILRLTGSTLSVKVPKGSRPPRRIQLPGILAVNGKCTGNLSPTVTYTVFQESIVTLGGFVSLPLEGGFVELEQKLNPSSRPKEELEFLVPHGIDGAVAKCVIYPDGRVVVDTGRPGSDSGTFTSVWLGGVVFHLESSLELAWNSLRMLQGKLVGSGNSIGHVHGFPGGRKYLIGNKFSSSKFEDRFTELSVEHDGRVLVKAGDTHVRSFSLSGLVAVVSENVFLGPRIVDAGKSGLIVEAVAEGIADFTIRSNAGALDIGKLKRDLLVKKCPQNVVKSSAWTNRLANKYERKSEFEPEVLEEISLLEAVNSVAGFRVTLAKLKRMLEIGESKPAEVIRAPIRRFVNSSQKTMQQSMVDYVRTNGGRKCRHQMDLMKKASEQELTELRHVIAWWNQWNTTGKYLTHSSLMGNQDIFTDTGKWVIPDDEETQTQLFSHMAWIYRKGYDTFISEIQTPLFPLIEDLDMESSLAMDNTADIDKIFIDEALCFVKERARALHILFPSRSEFTVYIYSSSGFNRSKNRWKSSFHLVWPDVIVNGELAPIIRQTTVEYFCYKSATNRYFAEMQKRLVNNYPANIWENVFDQTTSNANNGLRMPFCNKASWIKNEFGGRVPSVENRRCYPKGAVRISFERKRFDSVELETNARAKAMNLIAQAEEIDRSFAMDDQNKLVGDRTQYKQADRNTINRTSAFVAGMKSLGGDMREFWNVDAQWIEKIDNPELLSNEQVATWIRRGSCRRANAQLSDYNKEFVDCYLKADLVWFEGYTLETLRESEQYKKLTPAGQQGLKNRFRKYQESLTNGIGQIRPTGGTSDVEKLRELAKELRMRRDKKELETPTIVEDPESDNEDEEDNSCPPVEDEIDNFEVFSGNTKKNVFSFHGSMEMWKNAFSACLEDIGLPHGGYWIKAPSALIWISPRIESVADGFTGCLEVPRGNRGRRQVTATLYHHCGKVVVTGDEKSSQMARIVETVKLIAKPDDRLYHRLNAVDAQDYRDLHVSFPLIDKAAARAQREEFEHRWKIIETIASDTSTVDPETIS